MPDERKSSACTTAAMSVLAMMLVLSAPRGGFAQDDRSDDPPEASAVQGTISRPPTTPTPGILAEPRVLTAVITAGIDRFGDSGPAKNGWYAELSNMITGSGLVSLGPGYRQYALNNQVFVDVSAAASWHLYKMVQGRFEAPDLANHRLLIGSQVMWQDQTQVSYFGIGPDSLDSAESQFGMRSVDVVGYGAYRPIPTLSLGGEVGWLHRPDIGSPAGTFKPELPNTPDAFPGDPGIQTSLQPNYLHSEASITLDTRDYRGRPTQGALYRAALTSFRDQGAGVFTFRQYEGEGAQFVRLNGATWILALREWVVASDVPAGNSIPFYLLPALGGHNTLRGYADYRFHDQNLAVVNAESRWALFTHVDAAAFFDAGNVAPRATDLNLDKTSWGGGLRFHTERSVFARVDVAHGAEGWRVVFRTSDPFRLSRLTRRVAAIPFVP